MTFLTILFTLLCFSHNLFQVSFRIDSQITGIINMPVHFELMAQPIEIPEIVRQKPV